MKTLRFIGMALLATALNGTFTACSDDDDFEDDNEEASSSSSSPYSTDILGLWECYEMITENYYSDGKPIDVGEKLKFFSSDVSYLKPTASWGVNGKKCFVSDEDGTFTIVPSGYSSYSVDDPTEAQWDVSSDYDDNGICVSFDNNDNEIYILNSDSLLIVNGSNDWWKGVISIEDDVMTYSYVFQYGSSQTGKMYDEIYGPFISKFQRQ